MTSIDVGVDRFFVGATVGSRWRATAFIIDFLLDSGATYPQGDNVYQVDWERPFLLLTRFDSQLWKRRVLILQLQNQI